MSSPPPDTDLSKALKHGTSRRITPMDAFHAAKRKWLNGERVEIGSLATELGVARATLFRWVGSRDRLVGEILWSVCAQTVADADGRTRARGARRIAAILEQLVEAVRTFPPMSAFLKDDPEYALRLVTSKASPMQGNLIAAVQRLLEEEVARGELHPPLPLDTLAFLAVRVCESFLYADIISDQVVHSASVGTALELLLSGTVSKTRRGTSGAQTSPRAKT